MARSDPPGMADHGGVGQGEGCRLSHLPEPQPPLSADRANPLPQGFPATAPNRIFPAGFLAEVMRLPGVAGASCSGAEVIAGDTSPLSIGERRVPTNLVATLPGRCGAMASSRWPGRSPAFMHSARSKRGAPPSPLPTGVSRKSVSERRWVQATGRCWPCCLATSPDPRWSPPDRLAHDLAGDAALARRLCLSHHHAAPVVPGG